MAITDYDRQAVIWCAELADLSQFLDRADALNEKATAKAAAAKHEIAVESAAMFPGMGAADDEALAGMLKSLTDSSRLYICGHGGFGPAPKIVQWDAPAFVGVLKKNGLKHAKLINLVSCEMARDYSDDLEDYILTPANSFAALFHQELKTQEPALLTEVRAYTWFIWVINRSVKEMPPKFATLPIGTKLVADDHRKPLGQSLHKPKRYKISFYWEEGSQRRRYMNKDGNAPIDDDAL